MNPIQSMPACKQTQNDDHYNIMNDTNQRLALGAVHVVEQLV